MNSVQKSSELVTIVDAASANSHTVAQHCEQTAKVAVAPMQAMKAWEVSRFGLCCYELGVAGCRHPFLVRSRGAKLSLHCRAGRPSFSDPTFWHHYQPRAPEHTFVVSISGPEHPKL